jgi:hypothetical protein
MKMLKILKIIFVLAFTIQIGLMAVIMATPQAARAEDPQPLEFTPQIKIPEASVNYTFIPVGTYDTKAGTMKSDLLAKYIKAFYNYGISIGGILATIVLMGAGVLWLTSAGNDSKITQAKELITGSIVGLGILFGSWILLNTINPALLNMRIIETKLIDTQTLKNGLTCEWRCIDSGSKCEGGGGHDTTAATSPWRSTNFNSCKQTIGEQPSEACPTTKLYDCCCMNKTNVTSDDEKDRLIACLDNKSGGTRYKAPYSSCTVIWKDTSRPEEKGYCKTISDDSGGANKTECVTCLKKGEKCNNNVGDGDSECANDAGVCGSGAGGDCNAETTGDVNIAQDFISWLSSRTITCNSDNTAPSIFSWTTGVVYIECKCK